MLMIFMILEKIITPSDVFLSEIHQTNEFAAGADVVLFISNIIFVGTVRLAASY